MSQREFDSLIGYVTKIVVIGPNLRLPKNDYSTFHVHAADCADIKRSALYRSREYDFDKTNVIDATSVVDIAAYVYADQIAESDDTAESYENEFNVFPCVTFEKEEIVTAPANFIHRPAPAAIPAGHVVVPGAGITVPARSHNDIVTFELFSEDLFFEMSIETANLDETLALLESVPNVRNITVL